VINIKKNRSPGMALLWSIAIPGFGQLYNGDYLIGLLLVFLEFLINVNANINLAILFSFHGQFLQANQVANLQWLLFYPCVYSFSVWQAYNKAVEINLATETTNVEPSRTYYSAMFIGWAMGGTLGVIYCYGIGPIFGGIAGMMAGTLIGTLIERSIRRQLS
jgi:hypothetical protein